MTRTANVLDSWCVEATTAEMEHIQQWIAVMTNLSNAILQRLIGIAAPQAVLVVLEKEIVTMTMTALETWCVDRTTVGAELWTVV